MAKHIYMSQQRGTPNAQGGFDMSDSTRMHYRGPVGSDDDPMTFQATMGAQGYLVVVLDKKVAKAKEHQGEKRVGRPRGPVWVYARDLK